MELASFTGFVRTLIWIILIYYAFKFLARIFAPIIMQKAVSKMQEKMEQQMRNQQNSNQQQYTQTKKAEMPTEKKKVGEYIEFEEIE
ncbi:DUF4834 domain-containing protein [Flavobacterium chuncheonense]|uniref:DUF4834 domain-containing protein n=1 Tax=Flavobacterium chuncheonense TaxID=2026653 RepID=A0ABW5YJL2_9FLAO